MIALEITEANANVPTPELCCCGHACNLEALTTHDADDLRNAVEQLSALGHHSLSFASLLIMMMMSISVKSPKTPFK